MKVANPPAKRPDAAAKHVAKVAPVRPGEPKRTLPIGAEVIPDGGVHFRVWAPKSKTAFVEICSAGNAKAAGKETFQLSSEKNGYFSGLVQEAAPGTVYRYKLDDGAFPDPASRFQPQGPHGPSQVVDASAFGWTDHQWTGVAPQDRVIYEMHLGTLSTEGTYAGAMEHLPRLAELGITLLEVMPVADFPGRFGWGYDGVNLFAPCRLYGSPDDFRAFVDRAHSLGMGVILDVVYNHFGPDGNYLKHFSEHYFTDRHANEWGDAINFDDPHSGPVREFFAANAAYWTSEFHLDGLRLDATQQIFDSSPEHILAVISREVRRAGGQRQIYLVAENEVQNVQAVKPVAQGGYGLDALWNDDFHHSARVALTGKSEAYYSDYKGSPQELISALKRGFLYQGQWYSWQGKRRGTPAFECGPAHFVHFLENHDQVANSLRGLRLWQLTSPGRFKALTALLLLGPETPMLFQGQEFGASAPFLYFADHNPELARLVASGRREFLNQFQTISCPEADPFVAHPGDDRTFFRSKLDHSERQKHAEIYELHCDLLRMRREDPVFSKSHAGHLDGAVLGPEALVIRFFGEQGDDRLLLINLGADLKLSPAPEPLLAPSEGTSWKTKWSSESTCYSGCGTAPVEANQNWRLPGHAALVLAPKPVSS